jgi:hypothetical protein
LGFCFGGVGPPGGPLSFKQFIRLHLKIYKINSIITIELPIN